MKKLKIVGLGELLWDVLPSGKRLGGAPVNFAFYTKELGANAGIISAVGNDALGKELYEKISVLGIDTSVVQHNPYPTSTVDVALDEKGVPTYIIHEGVAWDYLEYTAAAEKMVSDADAICWGALAQRSEETRHTIEKILNAVPANCMKVFDINLRLHYYSKEIILQSLEKADILKLNEDELPIVAQLLGITGSDVELVNQLISRYSLKYVVFTRGGLDSFVFAKDGKSSHIMTPVTKIADTVGAGDSFTATFITKLLQGAPMEECHQRAVEVASFVCTQNGAINPLPKL
jgi:fructokinase